MIIDFHTHIFPEKIAERTISALASSSTSRPHTNGTEEGLISAMKSSGVSLSVNLPVLTKPSQIDSILSFGKEINRKYTSEIKRILSSGEKSEDCSEAILSFAGIHPCDESPEEHLELIKEMGFLGIKIHPDYQGTYFDDEKYIRILSMAKKLDLITVTHAGIDGAFPNQPIKCTPTRVLRALDKLGGYEKLVLAHLGGGKVENEVYELLAGESIYFDTAYLLTLVDKSHITRILEKHSEDKILFATDSPWSEATRDLNVIKSLGLSKSCEDKILSGNALNLLSK